MVHKIKTTHCGEVEIPLPVLDRCKTLPDLVKEFGEDAVMKAATTGHSLVDEIGFYIRANAKRGTPIEKLVRGAQAIRLQTPLSPQTTLVADGLAAIADAREDEIARALTALPSDKRARVLETLQGLSRAV